MKMPLSILPALLMFANNLAADGVWFESTKEQTGLLELYTSEGCSSCPPADRWLARLKEHPDLWRSFIPMALHVDYWDYIGWQDRFASAAHSKRQRRYAQEKSLTTVYTPGFLYNGQEWRQRRVSREVKFPAGNTPGILRIQLGYFRPNRRFSALRITDIPTIQGKMA